MSYSAITSVSTIDIFVMVIQIVQMEWMRSPVHHVSIYVCVCVCVFRYIYIYIYIYIWGKDIYIYDALVPFLIS